MKAAPRHARPRSFSALTLTAACALVLACSSSSPGGGTGGSTGTGGATPGTGGSNTGSGGANTGSGGANTGGTLGSGGNTGSGGSSNGGHGGADTGSGGVTGSGGSNNGGHGGSSTGSGGSSNGGHGGANTGSGGATGSGGSTGGGGSSAADCPANATFCSGFEDTNLPTGAIYMANAAPGDWTRDFAVDTSQHHSGKSSLRVKSNGESGATGMYQMLAVPSTPSAFWARFWIQSSATIGQADHRAYAGASIGANPNDLMIEFAEDSGIAFNTKDQDCFPMVGCTGQHPTNFYSLPAMTWECIELSFDATNQVQQLYVNGTLQIDARNYPGSNVASSLPYFKFGFDAYHATMRQIWYDDVVVAPTRIGCQ